MKAKRIKNEVLKNTKKIEKLNILIYNGLFFSLIIFFSAFSCQKDESLIVKENEKSSEITENNVKTEDPIITKIESPHQVFYDETEDEPMHCAGTGGNCFAEVIIYGLTNPSNVFKDIENKGVVLQEHRYVLIKYIDEKIVDATIRGKYNFRTGKGENGEVVYFIFSEKETNSIVVALPVRL